VGSEPPCKVATDAESLQADAIGRTISGKAKPGTLVRLVQAFSDRLIAEILENYLCR
jgi:hypothetical protein